MLNKNNKLREFAHQALDIYNDDTYAGVLDREQGNKEGTRASATLNNTALRQASLVSTAIAEYVAQKLNEEVSTQIDAEVLAGYIDRAIKSVIPTKLGQLENDKGYNSVAIYSGEQEPSPDLGKPGDLYVKFTK